MKALFLIAAMMASALAAEASFDPRKETTCKAANGTKILMNDPLVGGAGKAVAGNVHKTLNVAVVSNNETRMRITLDPGYRAWAPDYVLDLDHGSAQSSTRQEGSDLVPYIYIAGTLSSPSLFGDRPGVAVTCIQAAN